MPCFPIRDENGKTVGIMCGRGMRAPKCACGNEAEYLCDGRKPRKKSGTCDRNLCPACAYYGGEDEHFCDDCAEGAKQGSLDL